MPNLTGIFEKFTDIESIPIEDIKRWLKEPIDHHDIENFIANRIIYPQTIAVSAIDMEIDFAIFREIISRSKFNYYNNISRKLTIPIEIPYRFPPLGRLIEVMVQALEMEGVNQVLIEDGKKAVVIGTVIKPTQIKQKSGSGVDILINQNKYTFKKGTVTSIPIVERRIKVKIDSTDEIMVTGGSLGLVVDLRGLK